jgi:DNA-binding NtrC family response regulator
MNPATILVVDDDAAHRDVAVGILQASGYTVSAAAGGGAALEYLAAHSCDLILSELRLPDLEGTSLHQALERKGPHPPVIVMTTFAAVEQAVEAVKAGAYGYITKPCGAKRLQHLVSKVLEEERLRLENDLLRRELHAQWRCEDLIGRSAAMQAVFRMVGIAAETDGTVLILGESGTGKELVARAIHTRSARRPAPFVDLNCAGIPEALLESELFGHVRGAFTGAVRDKAGLFKAAHGGTLLLDEIGDAPPSLQVKLLRALETREVRPVGGTRTERVDVRVIAATNANLAEALEAGRFRKDLYYRLNVITIDMPRLADRAEDIPLLVEHFLARANARQRRSIATVTPEAMRYLMDRPWPGNVRELENAVERAVALAEGDTIRPEHLPSTTPVVAQPVPTCQNLTDLVTHAIRRALAETGGNRRAAARLLGIPERTLYRKLKVLNLEATFPRGHRRDGREAGTGSIAASGSRTQDAYGIKW